MTDLEGAGDHGPDEGAYCADAAEFAKRWNDWSEPIREQWVKHYMATSQAATRCILSNHDGLLIEVRANEMLIHELRGQLNTAVGTLAHMAETWTTPTETARLAAEIELLETRIQELTEYADDNGVEESPDV